jgi:hypothetical protein
MKQAFARSRVRVRAGAGVPVRACASACVHIFVCAPARVRCAQARRTKPTQVELLHGDDLRVAAAGRAALDAEGRALRWLADARHDAAAEVRAQRLAHADRRRRLALAQRRRVDARHDDVVAVARAAQPLEHAQVHLGLDGAVEVDLALQQARVRRDARDRQCRQRLRDVDVAGNGVQHAHARGRLRDQRRRRDRGGGGGGHGAAAAGEERRERGECPRPEHGGWRRLTTHAASPR